ncbi:MAG TPA: heparan-alpha-glucosaminide N-acetyltransferase domain-containing protein [Anaerolineales bacterium]|nr:heparan-alpha-glucosaminide N-acetyltransferase domain-containing protein [Anaerolineales bacterium]
MDAKTGKQTARIHAIDFLRGLVMVIMALDHVRMYFALGTWYAEPTNLATTTPLLFFTRWITHFCAPAFVFLAGTSAFLYGLKKGNIRETAWFLFTRGLWLIATELVIVNFAWTFDITYSFRILQVIWAIGISMVVLSALVFLPAWAISAIGILLVFGHNLLDPIRVQGDSVWNIIWYVLHQPRSIFVNSDHLVNFVYPALPWIGLMALGYVFGIIYKKDFPAEQRRRWLLLIGICLTLLFIVLRGFNLYGEPGTWQTRSSLIFSLMSFLNTTKYPPSLHFLLMTMGPVLILLAAVEPIENRLAKPMIVFGRVPFFFYMVHLYVIHALAMLLLVVQGRPWQEYILSARGIASGTLSNFGLGLGAVYAIWIVIVILLYPVCRWYQTYREKNPSKWWLSYL